MNILIFAAHPDDELLGVGGTLLKHITMGDKIYICIVTTPWEPFFSKEYIKNKIEEQKKVDKFLGTIERINLEFHDTKLNIVPHIELTDKILNITKKINPDIIYTHFEGDINLDHTLTHNAVLIATRPIRKIKMLCFETISATEWGGAPFVPNYWVDITDHIDTKIEIMSIYKSEMRKYPHPRSKEGIKALARQRGSEVLMEYTEAFVIIRDYWI